MIRRVRSLPTAILTDVWRADSGVTNSGGVVSWQSMLSSKVATEATNPPTFIASDSENAQPAVQFNGTTNRLKIATGAFSAGAGDRAWYFVRRSRVISGGFLYLLSLTPGAESIMSSITGGRNAVSTTVPISGASATREICVEVYNISGGTLSYYRDGVLYGTATLATVNLAAVDLYLCTSATSNWSTEDVFEWGVREDRALTTTEIGDLSAYAIDRYSGRTPAIARSGSCMCFGDSITAANVVDSTQAWREQLAARWPGVSFVGSIQAAPYHFHEGVGGNTFAQAQARLAAALAANPAPGLMTVMLGTNDASGGASGATIAARMRTFVEAAFAISPSTAYAVIETPPSTNATIQAGSSAYWTAMVAEIATMVGNGVKVFKVVSGSTLSTSTDIGGDGIHPNAAGHLIYSRALDGVLKHQFAVT